MTTTPTTPRVSPRVYINLDNNDLYVVTPSGHIRITPTGGHFDVEGRPYASVLLTETRPTPDDDGWPDELRRAADTIVAESHRNGSPAHEKRSAAGLRITADQLDDERRDWGVLDAMNRAFYGCNGNDEHAPMRDVLAAVRAHDKKADQ